MPRRIVTGSGGIVFHVMNRGARKLKLFEHDGEYEVFLQAFVEAHNRAPVDVFAYCLMPNHFHMVVRPREDGQLAEFMRLGTLTHSVRWHWQRGTRGGGCVYQGRYKAFPVQTNSYFLNACSYVEANALRAGLVSSAEEWPWSSLNARCRNCHVLPLSEWPILQPADWLRLVNERHSAAQLTEIRRALVRSRPLGDAAWKSVVAACLGLPSGKRAGRQRANSDRE